MFQLRINGNVRIDHVYDCNFGQFKKQGGGTTVRRDEAFIDYNYRIPNEIIKTRLVVVIGKHLEAIIKQQGWFSTEMKEWNEATCQAHLVLPPNS